jgi:hypothetical protein
MSAPTDVLVLTVGGGDRGTVHAVSQTRATRCAARSPAASEADRREKELPWTSE